MNEPMNKKDFQVAFRVSLNDFANEAEAEKCFRYLKDIDNKSKFYKKAIINALLILADEQERSGKDEAEEAYDQLFRKIQMQGLKATADNKIQEAMEAKIKEEDARRIADILAETLAEKGIMLGQKDKEELKSKIELKEEEVDDLFDL